MYSIDKIHARAFFFALKFNGRKRNRYDAGRFADRAVAWYYRRGGFAR